MKSFRFKIDVCDINGIDKDNFLPRFEWADIFFFEGGNFGKQKHFKIKI
ncbi:MAG: hypothetical protein HFJ45_08515 [Clostridia bacterium]|nr:hypothetical protein [Clostridia bacterium]